MRLICSSTVSRNLGKGKTGEVSGGPRTPGPLPATCGPRLPCPQPRHPPSPPPARLTCGACAGSRAGPPAPPRTGCREKLCCCKDTNRTRSGAGAPAPQTPRLTRAQSGTTTKGGARTPLDSARPQQRTGRKQMDADINTQLHVPHGCLGRGNRKRRPCRRRMRSNSAAALARSACDAAGWLPGAAVPPAASGGAAGPERRPQGPAGVLAGTCPGWH